MLLFDKREAISLPGRILCLSQTAEVFWRQGGAAAACGGPANVSLKVTYLAGDDGFKDAVMSGVFTPSSQVGGVSMLRLMPTRAGFIARMTRAKVGSWSALIRASLGAHGISVA